MMDRSVTLLRLFHYYLWSLIIRRGDARAIPFSLFFVQPHKHNNLPAATTVVNLGTISFSHNIPVEQPSIQRQYHHRPDKFSSRSDRATATALYSSSSRSDQEQRKRLLAGRIQFLLGTRSPLTQISLQGQAVLPHNNNNDASDSATIACAVLSTAAAKADEHPQFQQACLLIPLLPQSNQLWLLQQVVSAAAAASSNSNNRRRIIGQRQLLLQNLALVNRDGGLFDNLPYCDSWHVAPQTKLNRDAANNLAAPPFSMAKRDCYNRLTGKDWYLLPSRPATTTRPTNNFNKGMERKEEFKPTETEPTTPAAAGANVDESSTKPLEINYDWDRVAQQFVLEQSVREWQMTVAECDYEIAVARTAAAAAAANNNNNYFQTRNCSEISADAPIRNVDDDDDILLRQWQKQRTLALDQLNEAIRRLQRLDQPTNESIAERMASWIRTLFQRTNDDTTTVTSATTEEAAFSFRDVTAGAERTTTTTTMNTQAPYTSSYNMLQAILREQFQAEVVGVVLENTSLLERTVVIGGALVLQRLPAATKTVTVLGESLTIAVDEYDEVNDIVTPRGELRLVECDVDEAIGMSVAFGFNDDDDNSNNIPLWIETSVWEQASVMMRQSHDGDVEPKSRPLIVWETVDPELSLLTEGQASNQSITERVAPIRIPRSSGRSFLWNTLTQPQQLTDARNRDLFPTDNPMQSLSQYDQLTIDDKARTLMGMSNFQGKLPRPRVLQSEPAALDELLVPLIDESVRRQYQIREAEQRGDVERAAELRQAKSQRLMAKEMAEQARKKAGSDDDGEAERWDTEADFYASLRADVTQDEGSYSRFLDRDVWYERNRQRIAAKIDKSKFGTLLDGVA